MKELNNFEIPSFTCNVWKNGGSLVLTVAHSVALYEELQEGDTVKVFIKKLPKKV